MVSGSSECDGVGFNEIIEKGGGGGDACFHLANWKAIMISPIVMPGNRPLIRNTEVLCLLPSIALVWRNQLSSTSPSSMQSLTFPSVVMKFPFFFSYGY